MKRTWRAELLVGAVMTLAGEIERVAGEDFSDDFAAGLNPAVWAVFDETSYYTVDDSQGDVRFSTPGGGAYGFKRAGAGLRRRLRGDFDVQVAFRGAMIDRLDGTPGNQVQLNVHLGEESFHVVRSDEAGFGHNAHVYLNPPGEWRGAQTTSVTQGMLRITRTGVRVRGYFDAALLFEADLNAQDVRVNVTLQNNGTRDATAVTFDDFAATAEQLVPAPVRSVKWFTIDGGGGRSEGSRFAVEGTIGQPDAGGSMTGGRFSVVGGFWAIQTRGAPVLSVAPAGSGQARISWEPDEPGWILQETTDLAAGAWSNSPSGAANPATAPLTTNSKFYRLAKP